MVCIYVWLKVGYLFLKAAYRDFSAEIHSDRYVSNRESLRKHQKAFILLELYIIKVQIRRNDFTEFDPYVV